MVSRGPTGKGAMGDKPRFRWLGETGGSARRSGSGGPAGRKGEWGLGGERAARARWSGASRAGAGRAGGDGA